MCVLFSPIQGHDDVAPRHRMRSTTFDRGSNLSLNIELRVMHADVDDYPRPLTEKSDTFVTATLLRTSRCLSTPVCWNEVTPQWYHSLNFADVMRSDMLCIRLHKMKSLGTHVVLGETEVSVNTILARSAQSLPMARRGHLLVDAACQLESAVEYELHSKDHGGEICTSGRIALIAVDSSRVTSLSATAPEVGYTRFEIHKATAAMGRSAAVMLAGDSLKQAGRLVKQIHPKLQIPARHTASHVMNLQSTYALRVAHVERVFGDRRQHWNEDYPAARFIFASPASQAVQAALTVQHAHLYGVSPPSWAAGLANTRNTQHKITGAILDGPGLLRLVNYGVRRGKARKFSYVIIDDELRFAECGATFHRDMNSKHAMHARASPEVVYAGEMHFRCEQDGPGKKYTMVVDNASGTYAPDAADLPLVRIFFQLNFPGLEVLTLDFRDPLLAKYNACLLKSVDP